MGVSKHKSSGSGSQALHAPLGYIFSTVAAGIKYRERDDMALIYSRLPATIAGTFTRNRIKAAPVLLDMKRIRSGRGRAIIINSGNANACTGTKGVKDAEQICMDVSTGLNIPAEEVFIASTGVIGMPLPMQNVKSGINELIRTLGEKDITDVAHAIMTTDTFPKISSLRVPIGKETVTLAGIAKGSGMISPNMATMLCFLTTDLAIERPILKKLLKGAVEETFNRVTVDGAMSTNDTVLFMANGASSDGPLKEPSAGYRKFRDALYEVADELARMIARDGEGATKLITVHIKGAKSATDVRRVARSVANSPLVKTAIYGNDANWGRIMAAIGCSGVPVKEELIDISINGINIVKGGTGTGRDREASVAMRGDEAIVSIDLKSGKSIGHFYTCDLTEDYIRINTAYRT